MSIKVLSKMETDQITAPYPMSGNVVTISYWDLWSSFVIAPQYVDSGHIYTQNNVVYHNGFLFRANKGTSGTFNDDDWDSFTIISSTGKLDSNLLPTTYSSLSVTSLTSTSISASTLTVSTSLTVPTLSVSTSITVPVTPTADGHAASKKYVDNKVSAVRNCNAINKYEVVDVPYSSPNIATSATVPSSNTALATSWDSIAGWCVIIHGASSLECKNNNKTFKIIFNPTLSSTYTGTDFSAIYSDTYEIIVYCLGGSPKRVFNYAFVDSNDKSLNFLGDVPEQFETGYIYFFVARNFLSYKIGTGTKRRDWILNFQGRVEMTPE